MSEPVPAPVVPRGRRTVAPLFLVLVGILIGLPILAFLARPGDDPPEPAPFDPASPCAGADRQMWPGSYPELEAGIPGEIAGVAPDRLDSGRFCSPASLGTIYESGISEVRFAGAHWSIGDSSGLEVGLFSAPGLRAEALFGEYRRSAEAAEGVTVNSAGERDVDGRTAYRLELTRDGSRQVIVVWPSADGNAVQTVTGLNVKDELIDEAVAAFR